MLEHARLLEVLRYEPDTGLWFWRVRINGRVPAGAPAGSPNQEGYIRIMVDGHRHSAHVLAVFYMTGVWPTELVDHKDNDTTNNRWLNLRQATPSQNAANSGPRVNNKLGVKGVVRINLPCGARYRVRITKDGKRKFLGVVDSIKKAKALYAAATIDLNGEFARVA